MNRLCLYLAALVCASQAHAGAARFVATLSADLRTMSVDACFDDMPRELRAGDASASRYLGMISWPYAAAPPRRRGGRIVIDTDQTSGCLRYQVAVGKAADDEVLARSRWVGDDLVTTPELWLWRAAGTILLRFELPRDVRVSVPWQPAAAADTYSVAPTPHSWAALNAFGRLHLRDLSVPGGRLRIAMADADEFARREDIARWLQQSALAMTQVYGSMPRADVQVLVLPGDYTEPVPWGGVLRGGAPGIHFYVANDARLTDLRADWTSFHEFSHLFLPFVQRHDAYLSEGFASYLQNVTRTRAGNISAHSAWLNLYRGFERGRAGTRGQTLRRAARRMGRDRSYMRVYWSGAALALIADVALREHHGMALDDVLAKLKECCLNDHRSWSGKRLVATLDELSATDVFSTLNREWSQATVFPDVWSVLDRLGIAATADGITVDRDAELATIRSAIMAPRIAD